MNPSFVSLFLYILNTIHDTSFSYFLYTLLIPLPTSFFFPLDPFTTLHSPLFPRKISFGETFYLIGFTMMLIIINWGRKSPFREESWDMRLLLSIGRSVSFSLHLLPLPKSEEPEWSFVIPTLCLIPPLVGGNFPSIPFDFWGFREKRSSVKP